jgi:hypothetical protein
LGIRLPHTRIRTARHDREHHQQAGDEGKQRQQGQQHLPQGIPQPLHHHLWIPLPLPVEALRRPHQAGKKLPQARHHPEHGQTTEQQQTGRAELLGARNLPLLPRLA